MKDKRVILDVKNLEMNFTSGSRRKKMVVKAVDNVSFKIYEGETFGLVGESGCGKTTIARTIIRLYNPTAGQVYFDGNLISDKMNKNKLKDLTSKMQMIFQDPIASLNPRMTIEEIISEGLKVHGMKNREDRLKRIYSMLDIVGLTKEHATRYPHEFSGGQRQRIGIARALVTEPSLIIADEPVSALDVSIQAQVINLFKKLQKEMGLTILFIAHDLSVVKYFSDKIGVMYRGKLLEYGYSEDIYNNPIHPYTKALISAIPQPDPFFEKMRKRKKYDPSIHDYTNEFPSYHEVSKEHYIYCSHSEYIDYISKAEKQ